jgi:hypothetical protein
VIEIWVEQEILIDRGGSPQMATFAEKLQLQKKGYECFDFETLCHFVLGQLPVMLGRR